MFELIKVNIRQALGQFVKSEEGLVTVEWVAIACAVVVGGIAIAWIVLSGLQGPAGQIAGTLSGVPGQLPSNPF
jgi:hypothetical protein